MAADAADPDAVVSAFLHATYGAAADLGAWDRAELEDDPARWPQHRPGR